MKRCCLILVLLLMTAMPVLANEPAQLDAPLRALAAGIVPAPLLDVDGFLGVVSDGRGNRLVNVLVLFDPAHDEWVAREELSYLAPLVGTAVRAPAGVIVSAQIGLDDIELLASLPGVRYVEMARPLRPLLDVTVPLIGGDVLHDLSPTPYRGQNVVVGVVDTGIDWTHGDFIDPSTGDSRLAFLWDQTLQPGADDHRPAEYRYGVEYTGEQITAELQGETTGFIREHDQVGHGTHVMGTITGLGAATQDTIGVAWGAHWIATDPINQSVSYEFNNDIITAYQWFADPDGDPSTTDDVPDVIQNSWRINEGFGLDYTDCDTRWWAVIDNCEAAGAVTTWSAGNEGSGAQTIGSPADRATTLTNAFSVGAIDATNYGFPYPIAGFSSRGPTGCNVPAEQRIKPEVCAPGVGVYSSVPTSTYEGGWDGTSMAGPHVAGVVALMREANPDLDVDTIKEILMQTARDEGTAGEDNTYGWGVIDAYAAVEAAMTGFGRLEGMVKNASNGNTPIAGVEVQIVEPGRSTRSDATGAYAMSVAPGIYTVRTNHPSFATQVVPNVAILVDQTRVQNFNLVDIGAPVITNTTDLRSTDNTVGPYAVQSTITDFSSLAHARLYYRVNGHPFQMIELTPGLNDLFSANIPGQGYTSLVEYYITAADVAGNQASDPPEADPPQYYSFYVAPIVSFLNDAIEGGAPGWSHAVDGSGFVDQWHISTTRDHTTGGGHSWKCGDTGTGDYASLLNACLVTPSIELGLDSYLRFWHWMEAETSSAYPQYAYDGGIVEISVDGGAWQQIFPEGGYNYIVRAGSTPGPFPAGMQFFSGTHDWQQVTFNLSAYSEQEARIRFRFGSDGADVREGWYVDDIVVDGFMIDASATNEGPAPRGIFLHPADPNPFTGETHLHYQLNAASDVRLQVFDPSGRLVRTLVSGTRQPGSYETVWDSRDDAMRSVAPGIYFSRLQAGGSVVSQKLIVTR